MRPLPILLLLGLLPLTAPFAAETENAKPAEKPIDREEAQRLAAALDSDDAAEREKATEALIKLGPGVVPFLLPAMENAGAEQAMRIKTVGRQWGFHLAKAPPSENERLLELQAFDDDVAKRIHAFDAIFNAGDQGREVLQGMFEANLATPTVAFDLDRLVVTVGGRITGRAYLSNSGPEPYWACRTTLFNQTSFGTPDSYGLERPLGSSHRGLWGRTRYDSKPNHLMQVLRPIRHGAKGPHKDVDTKLESVGIHKLQLTASVPVQDMTHRTTDGTMREFGINRSRKGDDKFTSPSGSIQVFALPDFDKLTSDSRLALALTQDKAPAEKEKAVEATVTLRSKDNEKPVYLEQNLALYAWYAVLDEKGTPVKWGSWDSVYAGEGDACKARKLAPQASTEWKLTISSEELKPGTYRLVASYKAQLYCTDGFITLGSREGMLWSELDNEFKDAKPDSYIRYESGELGAKAAQTFTIAAKENSEIKKP